MNRPAFIAASCIAAGVVIGAGLALEPAVAQPRQAAPAPAQQQFNLRIAVIDVNRVFKGYAKFQAISDQFKVDIESKDNELRNIEKAMRGKIESINQLKNKDDRDRAEREAADLKFRFEKQRRDYQEDLVKREADMYGTVYKEMTDLLTTYCQQQSIHMVLRLRDDSPEMENSPQGVLQTLQRQVVYHHPFLDLTEVITEGLNTRFKAPTR